jgi:hypothetical protein
MNIGFVIGTPRSGKSRVFNILISSGCFAWISDFHNYFNNAKFSSLANRVYDIPLLGSKLYWNNWKIKYLPHPVETNSFWQKNITGFNSVKSHEIITSELKNVYKLINIFCKWQGKNIFLTEYSKWAKINYFSKIEPNAKFLHLVRDGRAVAYEYYKMIINSKYKEWNEKEKWIYAWPQNWRDEFEENSDSILAYCAYLWKFQLKLIQEEAKNLSLDRYLEIKYEDLVKEPEKVIIEIMDFFGIDFNTNISRYLHKNMLKNMNHEWKENLSLEQKNLLGKIIWEPEYIRYFEN